MVVSASELRSRIYRLLDQVAETGQPLEIERKGEHLFVVAERKRSKMDSLIKRKCIVGDPETLVHMDWSETWSEDS